MHFLLASKNNIKDDIFNEEIKNFYNLPIIDYLFKFCNQQEIDIQNFFEKLKIEIMITVKII